MKKHLWLSTEVPLPNVPGLRAKPSTYPNMLDYAGYLGMHIACLVAILTGVSVSDLVLCFSLYFLRMFGLMAGYHRYFSHKSFKTSRVMQFLLALLGTLAIQKGVLWWAAHHRYHHRYSDTPLDVHSPIQRSFLYSHSGWFLDTANRDTNYTRVMDLVKFPELVWLNNWNLPVVVVFAGVIYALFGLSGLIWGFFISTILIWHAVHAIGSFGHRFGGYRRFATPDNSRNKWFLGIVMLGEGWHNNHHYYPSSARQGFIWWEIDIAYYILKVLSWCGLVWDLKLPPTRVGAETPAGRDHIHLFKTWLVKYRLMIEEKIDALVEQNLGLPRENNAVANLKQTIQQCLDGFDERATDHLLHDPEQLKRTYMQFEIEVGKKFVNFVEAHALRRPASSLGATLVDRLRCGIAHMPLSHLFLDAAALNRYQRPTADISQEQGCVSAFVD